MKKLFSTRCSDASFAFATLVLRIGLGVMMIPHGYSKLVNFAAKSHSYIDPFHIGSTLSLSLNIFAEFFCAAFIILGLMTRLACIPLIIAMLVAIFFAHNGQIIGDGEKAALYLTGFIALLFTGPGKVSMDRLIGK
ncbi:MAG TPA: DoxX family protein [Chitinophagaceae bacterium]|jgi:putative oxidoreductase